jgi:CCR4-NOT transcription complex subunit 1
MNNIPDRALLKNLGHWLGIITIAKNKPILATVWIPNKINK